MVSSPIVYGDRTVDVHVYGSDSSKWHSFYSGGSYYDYALGEYVDRPERESITELYDTDVSISDADVVVKVNGVVSTGRTNSEGIARVSVPIAKVGTRVEITATGPNGGVAAGSYKIQRTGKKFDSSAEDAYVDVGYSSDGDSRENFRENITINPTYKSSKSTVVKVRQVTAGDYIKVKFGKKTYTKKFKKTAKSMKVKIKHKKYGTGTKIKVTHYNKYKQNIGKASSIVFNSRKVKFGMTKKEVKMCYGHKRPDAQNTSSNGWFDYYCNDSLKESISFSGGRVSSITYYEYR